MAGSKALGTAEPASFYAKFVGPREANRENRHSVRQVLLWLQQEALPLPSLQHGPQGRAVVWKLPVYASVMPS